MNILRQVGKELLGMFWADGWLAGAVLTLVAAVVLLISVLGAAPIIGGSILLFGSLAILVAVAGHAAGKKVER